MELFNRDAEFWGLNDPEFRNMVNDPYLNAQGKVLNNAGGRDPWKPRSRNCCGLNATGAEPVNKAVTKLQAWNYAKTGLALVGAYVVVKYLMAKLKKS